MENLNFPIIKNEKNKYMNPKLLEVTKDKYKNKIHNGEEIDLKQLVADLRIWVVDHALPPEKNGITPRACFVREDDSYYIILNEKLSHEEKKEAMNKLILKIMEEDAENFFLIDVNV